MTSRIVALGTVVVAAMLALVWLLLDTSARTRDGFHWVTHSALVIETTGRVLSDLRDAESRQRGFVLSHNPVFAQSVDARFASVRQSADEIVRLTGDNPVQNVRARQLRELAFERIGLLGQGMALARRGGFGDARDLIARGPGRELMATLYDHARDFLREEHALQDGRVLLAEQRLAELETRALVGGIAIALFVIGMCALIVHGLRRPVQIILRAMGALGEGERSARIAGRMGSREFANVARGYNAMADRLELAVAEQARSERELQRANRELLERSEALRDRGRVIELLGAMAHRMHAARTDEELAQVVRVFVPRVLPDLPGALYAHNNSRNVLVPIGGWGGFVAQPDGFTPDQCWALRRGQEHCVTSREGDVACAHITPGQCLYHCEPLLAGGEVIGTLYFEGSLDPEARFRMAVLAENIASALFNHRLQRGLREQTIRDPLTGLFNRRYMEEALGIEIARTRRSGAALSLVMADVDHFKRFNDDFGHDAGDAVLQSVATELRNHFRDGDVVCRFGGEEFTVIAPGSTADQLAARVELVRQAISDLSPRHGGRQLGATSMSFGIASWDPAVNRDPVALVKAADAALYAAKRDGRNRAVIEQRRAA